MDAIQGSGYFLSLLCGEQFAMFHQKQDEKFPEMDLTCSIDPMWLETSVIFQEWYKVNFKLNNSLQRIFFKQEQITYYDTKKAINKICPCMVVKYNFEPDGP